MNPEKLAKLQASVRIGGKGTPRRTKKKVHKKTTPEEDKKLVATLKKMNLQPLSGIEEVNMFKQDGSVMHFSAPQVQAAVNSNTFVVHGQPESKELTELVPGILNQLGPDALENLRKMADNYQQAHGSLIDDEKDSDDDDVPDLVENFDQVK